MRGPDTGSPRDRVGIKMNAQLRWLISRCWQDVDFIDASARSQAADDTLDAGICSIRHPGQDEWNIELRFFRHASYPLIVSRRSAGNPDQQIFKVGGRRIALTWPPTSSFNRQLRTERVDIAVVTGDMMLVASPQQQVADGR